VYVHRKGNGNTSLTDLVLLSSFFPMLRLNVKDKLFVFQSFYVCNLYGLVCNLVQLLEFDEVCNFLQLMEQFTLLLVPT